MGETIFDKHMINIHRFYGGVERGVCYQITILTATVQITESEFRLMVLELLRELLREFIKK